MRVVVTTESRFLRTPDGRVWTQSGIDLAFWQRYLTAFDRVRVVARVLDTPAVGTGAARVDGEAVEVWPVPHYLGPQQYLRRWPAIRGAVRRAAHASDIVILRVPSPIGSLLAAWRDRHRLPYALEVVGDPYEVFAPGVARHPLRPVVRARSVANLRGQARRAVGVAYVTRSTLQSRYPAGPAALTASFSSVELRPEAFAPHARTVASTAAGSTAAGFTLVSVGSLEQMYKGIDTLIEALHLLDWPDVRLVHVGDGRCRPRLEQLAATLGVAAHITFAGAVPAGEAVRRHLDAGDLFIMASRTEGLPRSLIEAMARGLPAVGSTVGGIPELLGAEYLVAPDDPAALAATVGRLLAEPSRLAAASAQNLARARDFAVESLTPARTDFYRAVRERGHPSAMARWLT